MRILYCGDVVGRTGRTAVMEALPSLREDLGLDAVVVNGENAAHGFGISPKIADEFFEAGCDVLTTGNHAWDQRDIIPHFDAEPRLIRPANFPSQTPGRGHAIIDAGRGRKLLVAQVMGRLFMDPLDDPFRAVDDLLSTYRLKGGIDAILVDIHGEASSEKMAMGHFCDGRASIVVGSHTHVPSADIQILPGGTAYQSDAGMCGDYDSVIGMKKQAATARFVRKMPGERLSPADGPATVCGLFVEIDDATGLATRAEAVRLGGRLAPAMPAV
ncbi:MAG: TIGR00282 family metallophosphoesterase [Rhodospirillaceae bacterium]